jgi:O-antigen/teichoic acid export membrane protein
MTEHSSSVDALEDSRGDGARVDDAVPPSVVNTLRAKAGALTALINGLGRGSLQGNALAVFVVRVASAALLFISQVVLARWMGAAQYGVYVSLWTAVLLLGGFSHLGLSAAMMRLVPQYQASGAFDALRGILLGGRLLAVASATAVAALACATLWLDGKWLGFELSVPVALALVCLPFYTLTDVQDGIGRGQGWTLEAIVPPYLLRPALVLLFVWGAHTAGLDSTALTTIVSALLATAGAALVQTLLIERRIAENVPRGKSSVAVSTWLTVSLPLLAVGACEVVLQNADVMLLNFFRPSAEVGIYYAATKTAGLALFVHYAVGSAYAGRIAAAAAVGDEGDMRRLVHESVRWTFYPSLVVTLTILALGLPLLSQFGAGFTEAYPLMFILAAGVLARAATGPSELILNMLGHQRACATSLAAAAVVSVSLNAILIPILGLMGASIATASALTTAAFLNWHAAKRLSGVNLFVLAAGSRASAQS